jgi:dTDP-4-amino-4,6-dideoxygalactose transaminase
MNIPFLDLKSTYTELQTSIDAAVARVLSSGHYILGPEVEQFEQAFAKYTQSPFCVGVANGLDALVLALKAVGVQAGDEVLVPSNTYIATWLAVSQCGATPIPIEPHIDTHNMNAAHIEAAITKKTKVIMPVHLYGQPADLQPILEIAQRYNLRVVEDGAQAHGASYQNKPIGCHGDIVTWSFYPGKNLGAFGDGGAITTANTELADRIRVLRNYGSRVKYVNEVEGINSRLDPVQAAVLSEKLKHLSAWNDRRQAIAQTYLKGLASCSSITLPKIISCAKSSWHLFVIRHPQRDVLQQALGQAGVATLIHYPIAPHLQQAYAHMGLRQGQLPIAEQLANEVLSLPIGPHMSVQDAQTICQLIGNFNQ